MCFFLQPCLSSDDWWMSSTLITCLISPGKHQTTFQHIERTLPAPISVRTSLQPKGKESALLLPKWSMFQWESLCNGITSGIQWFPGQKNMLCLMLKPVEHSNLVCLNIWYPQDHVVYHIFQTKSQSSLSGFCIPLYRRQYSIHSTSWLFEWPYLLIEINSNGLGSKMMYLTNRKRMIDDGCSQKNARFTYA